MTEAVDAEMQAGVFQLVTDEGIGPHIGHPKTLRSYPRLHPPASFVDCWTCMVTWELGR